MTRAIDVKSSCLTWVCVDKVEEQALSVAPQDGSFIDVGNIVVLFRLASVFFKFWCTDLSLKEHSGAHKHVQCLCFSNLQSFISITF